MCPTNSPSINLSLLTINSNPAPAGFELLFSVHWHTFRAFGGNSSTMSKKTIIILGSIAIFLVALHLALPPLIKWYVNTNLNDVNGMRITIRDVDLKIWRGAFEIEGFMVREPAVKEDVPLLYAGSLHFTIDWNAIFHGRIVSDVNIDTLEVNFVNRPDSLVAASDSARKTLAQELADLVPIDINELLITNGNISYKDFQSNPTVDISLSDLNVEANNLSNVVHEGDTLPAIIEGRAYTLGGGELNMEVNVNVMRDIPNLDMQLSLEDAQLAELNDFFRAYGKFDFQSGTMSVYSEIAVADGVVDGYNKAILEDINIVDKTERERQRVIRDTYESVLEGVAEVFSVKEDKLATKVPIEGSIEAPGIEAFPTLFTMIRNAWIKGMENQLDQTIVFEDAIDRSTGNDGGNLIIPEED